MTTESNQCKECGEKLIGRSDKKFCSDQCRNAYNNRVNSDNTKLMRNINNALRKNRRVLKALNPNNKIKVTRERMVSNGFNFKYYTNTYTTKNGTVYYFCYEMGYLPLDDDTILIVTREIS